MSSITVTGVILAGGRARRMDGADKGLMNVAGLPLVEHLLATLRGQVHSILINANRNVAHYSAYGVPVFTDVISGYQGPLAGIHRALCLADTEYVLSVPCDTPCLPHDLVQRMLAGVRQRGATVCVAHDGRRLHPVIALMQRTLAADLLDYLDAGNRRVEDWLWRHAPAVADFSDQPEAFVNLNTMDECRMLEEKMKTASVASA
ncbi:MAG: molybdenum cofactor guanylyltransferase MobA [Gammaproteobacteria bacterium]|nr:molybdenum cofactor guanylyltransferase MobA [Gammaproteobacteria bacterium]